MNSLKTAWIIYLGLLAAPALGQDSSGVALWEAGRPKCALILPSGDRQAARLAQATLSRFLPEFYAVELPVAEHAETAGTYIVCGTPDNNPLLGQLVQRGMQLTARDIGEEGFRILTHQDATSKYIVVYGKTPRALKHGCQELIFYHIAATAGGGSVDWPLDVMMKPEFAYRGTYMLPCWAQHDSLESWRRVLLFNSELTLNRVWFWLDGFPVAGHAGEYDGTDLADERNVQSLIDLTNDEELKFYIGGGWMSWQQEKVVGKDPAKAADYYLQYLRTFKHVGGFYFEPAGETGQSADWRPGCESLRALIRRVLKEHPEFERAVAIGQRNSREYLELMSELDPKRVFWWWCWGDPHRDNPFEFYPSVLAWHTTLVHGSAALPGSATQEQKLLGMVTSYDPGMGFGNPWNGGTTLGRAPGPRNFDPRTIPYFSHEYRFRERCWNTRLSDDQFTQRLGRRLFDADMPPESIHRYLKLADLCWQPAKADAATIDALSSFVKAHAGSGTPRNRDTLQRMTEAVEGLRHANAKPAAHGR